MKTVICFLFLVLAASVSGNETPGSWSIVVYSVGDEKEIDPFSNRIIQELLEAQIPEGVEIIIEHDSLGNNGIKRFYRKGNSSIQVMDLPEADSASPQHFKEFIEWANEKSSGKNRMFVTMAHSWGWKGIIQDFYIPNEPKKDTMMPLREFARVLKESSKPFDLVMLEACVLGNVESIVELQGVSRYLIASKHELPFSGFPVGKLLDFFSNPRIRPRQLAHLIPEMYVTAYGRQGEMAKVEGEYAPVSLVALDLKNWERFRNHFKKLTDLLMRNGFRQFIEENPNWLRKVTDEDHNVDFVELLLRVRNETPEKIRTSEVQDTIDAILEELGFPEKAVLKNRCAILLEESLLFELNIQADELVQSHAFEKIMKNFKALNSDLTLPKDLSFAVVEGELSGNPGRVLRIQGSLESPVHIRPWLPGTQAVHLRWLTQDWIRRKRFFKRTQDYSVVKKFPSSSILLSAATTQGWPYQRAIGINFYPLMNFKEMRGTDTMTGLAGPDFYRSTAWNRQTGWGDLILLK